MQDLLQMFVFRPLVLSFDVLCTPGTSKISSRRSPLQIKLFVHIILKGTAFYSELILLGEVLSLSSNGCVKVHIVTREAQHNLINMSMYHALVVGRDRMSSGFSTSNHIF